MCPGPISDGGSSAASPRLPLHPLGLRAPSSRPPSGPTRGPPTVAACRDEATSATPGGFCAPPMRGMRLLLLPRPRPRRGGAQAGRRAGKTGAPSSPELSIRSPMARAVSTTSLCASETLAPRPSGLCHVCVCVCVWSACVWWPAVRLRGCINPSMATRCPSPPEPIGMLGVHCCDRLTFCGSFFRQLVGPVLRKRTHFDSLWSECPNIGLSFESSPEN